jgi:hypothetical protein
MSKSSDQATTPANLWRYLYRKLFLKKSDFFDLTPLLDDFSADKDFDALTEEWANGLNFLNSPFSLSYLFFRKAAIEYSKGKNIVMLVPTRSADSEFVRKHIR